MKKICRGIISLLICVLLLPMVQNVQATTDVSDVYSLQIHDYVPPVKIGLGHTFPLSGTILDCETIESVTVDISDADSSNKIIEEVTLEVFDNEFNLSKFNSLIHFENLTAGNKIITIKVKSKNRTEVLSKNSFEVKKSSDISISGAEVPDRIVRDYYTLKGIVTYNEDIKGIKIKVKDVNTKKYEINKSFEVNAKVFDLRTIAHEIDFTKLKSGPKKLEYYIINEDGSERIFKGEYFNYVDKYYNVPVDVYFYRVGQEVQQGKFLELSGYISASTSVSEAVYRVIDVKSNKIEKETKVNKFGYGVFWIDQDDINTKDLTPGDKKLKILAKVDGKEINVCEKNFTVIKHDKDVAIEAELLKIDTNVFPGDSLNVKGIINSNKKVDKINVKIYSLEDDRYSFENQYDINSSRFTFEKLESDLSSIKLERGQYEIDIKAIIDEGEYPIVYTFFKVTDEQKVSIDGFLTPTYIDLADPSFGFEGIINSKEVISKVSVGIKRKNSKDYLMFKEMDNDTNTFDLSNMNKYFDFSKLPTGQLEYKVSVNIGGEEITLRNGYIAVLYNDPAIDLSGMKIKAALAGEKRYFKFEGEIKAQEDISTVEVVINKLDGDYTKVFNCDSNTFNMDEINKMIDFRTLYKNNRLNLNIKVKTKSGKTARTIKNLCITDSGRVVALEKSFLEYSRICRGEDNIDLRGVITSNETISQVKVVIPESMSNVPLVKAVDVNSNTFDLKDLKFELGSAYKYEMDIYVIIGGKSYLLDDSFLQ